MPKLRWLSSAQADLLDILEFVARQSGSTAVGIRLVADLRGKCSNLARLPGAMGRPRPELRPDIRSFSYNGYVIFFRYQAGTFQVVNIVHGHRDIDAWFADDKHN